MQALSIQLEQIAPVQKQDNQFIAQGRDNSVQVESTFQKKLEQAQKEQDVQNKSEDRVSHEEKSSDRQSISSVNKESTQSRQDSINIIDEKTSKLIDNKELTQNSKLLNKSVDNQVENTSDLISFNTDRVTNEVTEEIPVINENLDTESGADTLLNNIKHLESNDNFNTEEISMASVDDNFLSKDFIQLADVTSAENEKSTSKDSDVKSKSKINKDKASDNALSLLMSGRSNSFSSDTNVLSQMTLNDSNNLDISALNGKAKNSKTNKAILNVIDERTVLDAKNSGASITTKNVDSNGTAEMSFSLSAQSSGELLTEGNHSGTKDTSRFQSMLSDQIQSNANEFVKNGSIILRDNNSGTINLILHPEELGNVKISLKLSDKVIAAQITVATEEAYNAFKSSIDALKSAFAAGGFETGGFDLSWSGQNQEQGQKNNDTNIYAALYEGRLPDADIDTQSTIASSNGNSYHSSVYSMQAVNVVI